MSGPWGWPDPPAPAADIAAGGARPTDKSRLAPSNIVNTLKPSGNADTDTINIKFALATQQRLDFDAGDFYWKGLITVPTNVVVTGKGGKQTQIHGASADAQWSWGPGLGSLPLPFYGKHGGFTIDGAGIAVGAPFTGPLVSLNTNQSSFIDFTVINGVGDNLAVIGQNCTFDDCASAVSGGCCLVWDNGCGGNMFYNLELSNASQRHLEIRQTVAPPAGAYPVPEFNYVIGGRFEKANGGVNLGCVRQLAGTFNYLIDCQSYTTLDVSHIKLQPNTAPGRSGDFCGRLYLRNFTFTGGGIGIGTGVETDAVVGGVATALNADAAVIFQDETVFSGMKTEILWGTTVPVYQDGNFTKFNVTNEFLTQGTGAVSSTIGRAASQTSFPDDITVIRDLYLGDYLQTAKRTAAIGGYGAVGSLRDYVADPAGDNTTLQKRLWLPDGSTKTYGGIGLPDANDLKTLYSQYRGIVNWRGGQAVAALAAGTYALWQTQIIAPTSNISPGAGFYLDPADYPGFGTLKYRIQILIDTNTVAPGVNFTVGLYPIATVIGGASVNTMTLGAVVAGSAVSVNAPAASTPFPVDGLDFAAPAAGQYCLAVLTSGATAANSATIILATLQQHRV